MKIYNLSLSEKDCRDMAKNFEQMAEKLGAIKDLILKALAQYTQERVVFYIATSVGLTGYVGTDTLVNSIAISDIFKNTIMVYTDLAYAQFVEYGTGVKGAGSGYTEMPKSIKINGKTYKKYNKDFQGQVAHKFMFNAFQDLKKNYLDIARTVLKEEGII